MNSQERHEARYQRRKAKRLAHRDAVEKNFEEVMSFENLAAAGSKCCKNVRWKTSTINFETYLLRETYKNYDALMNDKYKFRGFISFYTYEHGKVRDIDAMAIQDRQIQKCLCNNILTPTYSRNFVYDNGACLEGKGMDFQLNRIKKHLHDHYRKYDLEGGIYQFDFSGYFKSLPHTIVKQHNQQKVDDPQLQKLFNELIDDFNNMGVMKQDDCGVGLGGEVSQLVALEYANSLDHYIKDVLKIHGYGRYNDDGYVISNSIAELQDIREKITQFAQSLGITINDKKNKITPFKHHSFKFLKIRFTLTETGKVVMKINTAVTRLMRRKLRSFKQWVSAGRMTAEEVFQSYQSYRAHLKRCNSYRTLNRMDKFLVQLFKNELVIREKRFPCTLRAYTNNNHWVYICN